MMEMKNSKQELDKLYRWLYGCIYLMLGLAISLFYISIFHPSILTSSSKSEDITAKVEDEYDNTIENGIHLRTGLVDAEGLMIVVNNCTTCHSAQLITQNRMTAERWNETIKWMQETQNLWELGSNQEVIVDYLVTNYPQPKKGRRMVLKDIEWYELEE